MLLGVLTLLWDTITNYVAKFMDTVYESNYFMALFSCIMATILMAHLKSATVILTEIHKPKRRRSLIERQPSPINIESCVAYKMELQESLRWYSYDELPPAVILENNGCTVIMRICCSPEYTPYITGGNLPANYYFMEASFKWSSEHSIDSHNYAMEMQVLHAANISDAPYEYLTVSYMFDLAQQKNYMFDQIINNLASIRTAGSAIELPPFDLATLMWCFGSDYYSYRGTYTNGNFVLPSLWVICSRTFYIAPEQLARFRDICDLSGRNIVWNARQKKPLGDRCVSLNCY
ncbi:PREDICTED: carbonic anhydrase 1 [Drosophila arizonae]|uniref:Carbonic anhydrase 1 n=1 Tax=Drosophila arizonae TaxID=7263 RepID=A0ABM1PMB1_DROAR|nr:PREDICTED: carbonic anhydrase 1 [Drosophila arizonae]